VQFCILGGDIQFSQFIFILSFALLAVALEAHEGTAIRADAHAPIGVMGDHMHKQGEWMISFRSMRMNMSGNLQGSNKITDEEIVSTVENRFSSMPGMPVNLRVVPQKMTVSMQMLGLMYAPVDNITLMAMLNFVNKDMDLRTFQGMMGTTELGDFSSSSSGLGDVKLSALIALIEDKRHKIHLNLGLSFPTGEIDEEGRVLTPMNMQMNMRLPYAMQLGAGTTNFEPALTYNGRGERFTWGGQLGLVLPLDKNTENYDWGGSQKISTWLQYLFVDSFSASLRFTHIKTDKINGMDSNIMAPVQTANPDNYGGDTDYLSFGVNLVGQEGGLRGHRLAGEYFIPLSQDANGVQMEMDKMLMLGYQYAF